ncbi:MAG: rRNA maturation RNase YbeY [Elusimicrobiota bacterium]
MRVLLSGAGRFSKRLGSRILRGVREALGARSKRRGELCVILVGDKAIRKINRDFLRKDRLTDVIAFEYDPQPGAARADAPFGDIYIALGVARRQGRAVGHGLSNELLTLAVHGALHLAGYDDGSAAGKRRMFARQDRIVKRLML